MTSDIMVSSERVSMRFSLGIEKGFSVKQWFVNLGKKEGRERQDFYALRDVSFTIRRGEVVGLVASAR